MLVLDYQPLLRFWQIIKKKYQNYSKKEKNSFFRDYKSTTEELRRRPKKIIDNRDYMQKLSTNSAKIVSYGTNFIADIIFANKIVF